METELLILFTLAIAFTIGAAAIGLASLDPRLRATTAELWALYHSEFAIVGMLLVPAALGSWYFALLLIVTVRRGQFELFRIFHMPAWGVLSAAAMGGSAALVVFATLQNFRLIAMALAVSIAAVGLFGLAVEKRHRLERTVVAGASLFAPGLLAAAIAGLRAGESGFVWLFVIYATVEIADAFALLFGKLFGRTRILPRLSPKKTAEGLAGGFLFGGVAGFLLGHYLLGLPALSALDTAVAALIAGFAGDLLTSAVKRWRHVKDFPPVLKLHGGVLDIYDSFLLAGPAVFLLRPLLATQ